MIKNDLYAVLVIIPIQFGWLLEHISNYAIVFDTSASVYSRVLVKKVKKKASMCVRQHIYR